MELLTLFLVGEDDDPFIVFYPSVNSCIRIFLGQILNPLNRPLNSLIFTPNYFDLWL